MTANVAQRYIKLYLEEYQRSVMRLLLSISMALYSNRYVK